MKGVVFMKKHCRYLMIPLLLLLSLTANASNISETPNSEQVNSSAPKEGVGSLDWFLAMDETYWSEARGSYSNYHMLQFYTSMDCDDVCCTNPEHFHWCPMGLCLDETHGHDVNEYKMNAHYAPFQPPCPCHKDIKRYQNAEWF